MKTYVGKVLVSIDQLANTLAGGDPDETISSRAAKAALRGQRWGCVLCRVLDWLQTDHCTNSIEPDRGERVPSSQPAKAGFFTPNKK